MLKRVLLVEPSWDTRRVVGEALHGLPFELSFASSGEQALAALSAALLPEIVLLEPAMPGISGWEVLARIDIDPQLCHIPVLVVTALPDVCAPHGHPVLGKPFTTEQLLAAVARLCVGQGVGTARVEPLRHAHVGPHVARLDHVEHDRPARTAEPASHGGVGRSSTPDK